MSDFLRLPAWIGLLKRNPHFALTVIVVLGLGIGANVATLGLLYRYYVSPLPYPHGDQVLNVSLTSHRTTDWGISIPIWRRLQKGVPSLANSGLYQTHGYNFVRDNRLRRLSGTETTASLFSTLGVHPLLGRVFGSDSNKSGAQPVVILSYRLWQTLFDGNSSAIGQTLKLNGKLFSVIGVMPKHFNFPTAQSLLWTPKIITEQNGNAYQFSAFFYQMVVRLAPGNSKNTFLTQANVVLKNEIANFPASQYIPDLQKSDYRIVAESWRASTLGHLKEVLTLVPLAATLLMLLVWFNLANLFIARAFTQRGEFALRRIIGANAWTLVSTLLRENFLLSLIGAGLGVALGRFLVGLFSTINIADASSSIFSISWSVLILIAVVLAIISAGIFTLVGLDFLHGHNLATALNEGDGRTSQGLFARRVRKGLLVAQIALTCVLGGTGFLLGRSLLNLNTVNLGFRPDNLVTFKLSFPLKQYSTGKMVIALNALHAVVGKLPGSNDVGISSIIPFDGSPTPYGVFPDPPNPNIQPAAYTPSVDSDYLKVLGVTMLAGRNFDLEDAKKELGVAVINTLSAKQIFGTENVIGRNFSFGSQSGYNNYPGMRFRVIGLVSTAHQAHVGEKPKDGTIYMYRNQVLRLNPGYWHWRTWYVTVRSPLPAATVIARVKNAARKVLPGVPLYDTKTMNQRLGSAMASSRLLTILVLLFSISALVLASVGLYAVQAYAVAQRAREFAIRAALGAERSQLLVLVLGETARLLVYGLVVGLAGLAGINIVFASTFYGIAAVDPVSMAIITVVLALAVFAASWFPAWHASHVAPDKALNS